MAAHVGRYLYNNTMFDSKKIVIDREPYQVRIVPDKDLLIRSTSDKPCQIRISELTYQIMIL
jgi:hypothetical protein